jgi:hypothetical protein
MRDADGAVAIVRVDDYQPAGDDRITVKEVVWTVEDAEWEVARLNAVNADKHCHYFWTPTRVWHREKRPPPL